MAIGPELKGYLEGLRHRLRLNPLSQREILRELYTHIEDRTQELCQAGLSQAEASSFIRFRQRPLKAGALAVAGLLILPMVNCSNPNVFGSPGLVVAAFLSLAFLFSPALLEHKIGMKGKRPGLVLGWMDGRVSSHE